MFKIVKSLALVSVAVAAVIGGTYAYFSDTAASKDNKIKTGILSIDNGKVAASEPIVIDNAAPGWVSAPVVITIENNGNIDLGWLGDWQFDGGLGNNVDLKDALYIKSAKMEFLSKNNEAVSWLDDNTAGYEPSGAIATDTSTGDLFIENGVGHGPYKSFFDGVATGAPFGVVSLNRFAANSGMLPGTVYEHTGALRPGYKYRLTVEFGLAPGAGNEYQNLGPVTAKLVVKATQLNAAALEEVGGAGASAILPWMTASNGPIADQTE